MTPSSGQIAHPEQVWPKYTSISIQLPPEVHLYVITLETCYFSGLECPLHANCIISRSLQVSVIDWWLRFHLFIEENRLRDPERGEKNKGKASTKALNVAEKWKNAEFLIGVQQSFCMLERSHRNLYKLWTKQHIEATAVEMHMLYFSLNLQSLTVTPATVWQEPQKNESALNLNLETELDECFASVFGYQLLS